MNSFKFLIVPLVLFPLVAIAACGDDDDDDRLSDEEYFTEVDELNRPLEQLLDEGGLFEAESAKAGLEEFADAASNLHDSLTDLNPPEDLQDVHDRYVAGVDDAVEFIENAADETSEDAPIEELESILFGGGNPFIAVTEAECELATIAEERGTPLEVLECDDEEEGEEEETESPEGAGDNPAAVEGTEFEFSFEDGAFTTETTGIVLTNAGEQPHELIVFEVDDATIEEAIEVVGEDGVPPDDAPTVGATGAAPGDEGTLTFEAPLRLGRYLIMCFVQDAESGELHAELGMAAEVTVVE